MKNIKLIIGLIIGIIIASGITVYAAINASDINYKNNKSVADALNDLYTQVPKGTKDITSNGNNIDVKQYETVNVNATISAQQVATITTRGATYTFQNDGYVVGTCTNSGWICFDVYDDDAHNVFYAGNNLSKISLYAPKNTVLYTRNDGGSYNLTIYEFK